MASQSHLGTTSELTDSMEFEIKKEPISYAIFVIVLDGVMTFMTDFHRPRHLVQFDKGDVEPYESDDDDDADSGEDEEIWQQIKIQFKHVRGTAFFDLKCFRNSDPRRD